MEASEESLRLLRGVQESYTVFLHEQGLHDAYLARMTFYSWVRKDYIENPVEDATVQIVVLEFLDRWMDETLKAMNDAMPKVLSTNLHVATKR